MESVLLAAAMLAASTNAAPVDAPAAGAVLDQRCFRLMADLAEDGDPRIRGLGRTAAQYFLGRIDAARPGFDPDSALEAPAPFGLLAAVEWGYGFRGLDADGTRGTHVIRVSAYKMF